MNGFPSLPRSWTPPGQETRPPELPSQPYPGNSNPALKPQQQGGKPVSSAPGSGDFFLGATPPSKSEAQKAREDYERALLEKKQAQENRIHHQILLEEKNRQILKSQIEKFEEKAIDRQKNQMIYAGLTFLGFFVLVSGLFVILRRPTPTRDVHVYMSYAPPKFDTPPSEKRDKGI